MILSRATSARRVLTSPVLLFALLALTAALLPDAAHAQTFRPQLEIDIPDLTFSSIRLNNDSGYVDVPWIAQYISAITRVAMYVAALFASVMMMVGGFQYLTAGTSDRAKKGKERISNALIGLVLTLLSYTMLRTVNPALLDPAIIRIPTVAKKQIDIINPAAIEAATGRPPISGKEMLDLVRAKARAAGDEKFDCFVYGSLMHESGGRPDAIGHDENHRSTAFSITARRNFQNSGKKYSGIPFDPVGCNDQSCQNQGPANDDVSTFDPTKPPLYGLDWRYSHGFGAGQSTIFGNSRPCPGKDDLGRGFQRGAKCYTIPDLMDPEKQAEAMIDHYKTCWGRTRDGEQPGAGYVCYQGAIAVDNPQIVSRVRVYEKCVEDAASAAAN